MLFVVEPVGFSSSNLCMYGEPLVSSSNVLDVWGASWLASLMCVCMWEPVG